MTSTPLSKFRSKPLRSSVRLAIAVPWCLLAAVFAIAAEPAYHALQVNGTTHQPSNDTPLNLNSANVTGPLDWTKLGGKPTTLTGYGITDAQPLDSDLTAVAALATTPWGRALLTLADAGAARTTLGLGTAATANTGTAAGNVVTLDGVGKLPAVNGSQLTGVTGSVASVNAHTGAVTGAQAVAGAEIVPASVALAGTNGAVLRSANGGDTHLDVQMGQGKTYYLGEHNEYEFSYSNAMFGGNLTLGGDLTTIGSVFASSFTSSSGASWSDDGSGGWYGPGGLIWINPGGEIYAMTYYGTNLNLYGSSNLDDGLISTDGYGDIRIAGQLSVSTLCFNSGSTIYADDSRASINLSSNGGSIDTSSGGFINTNNNGGHIDTSSGGGNVTTNGSGSPEGILAAPVGSIYTDKTSPNASGHVLWIKENGGGSVGWVGK